MAPAPRYKKRTVVSLSKVNPDRTATYNATKKHHEQVREKNAAAPNETHRHRSALAIAKNREPDNHQSSEKARDRLTCKKRPDSRQAARSTGGTGQKKFIPWC